MTLSYEDQRNLLAALGSFDRVVETVERVLASRQLENIQREETMVPVWGERPRTVTDAGMVGDNSPVRHITHWQRVARFVTPWLPVDDKTAAGE